MADTPITNGQPPQTLNIFGGILAVGMLGLLYALSYAFVYIKIPTENTSNISQITGAVLLQVGIIIGWFYRNSQEAKKQAETISTLVTSAAVAQQALTPSTTTTSTTTTTAATPPTVATVSTPDITVPLKAGQVANVTADKPPPPPTKPAGT